MPVTVRSGWRLVVGSVAAAVLGLTWSASVLAAPSLSFVGTGEVAVSAKAGGDTATASVTVLNNGAEEASVVVTLDAVGATPVELAANTTPLEPGRAATVPLTFAGVSQLKAPLEGVLVVSGGAKPIARLVTITPPAQPANNWAQDIVVGALLAGLLFAVYTLVLLPFWLDGIVGAFRRLASPAPGPKWSFDSWAAILTGAGAVLGAALAGLTLPDVPQEVDKETLVTLNVFFGILLVAGPFLFQALRRPTADPLEQDGGLWGTNLTLLLACCLTFAATIGEIATLALVFWEGFQLDGDSWKVFAFAGTAGVVGAAGWYFALTVPRVVAADWKEIGEAAEEAAAAAAAAADKKRMSLLATIIYNKFQGIEAEVLDPAADQQLVEMHRNRLKGSRPRPRPRLP